MMQSKPSHPSFRRAVKKAYENQGQVPPPPPSIARSAIILVVEPKHWKAPDETSLMRTTRNV